MSFSLSVIIPVHNRWDLTEDCLKSLALHTPATIEVIVVDNCSIDNTPQACPVLGAKLFGDGFVYLRQPHNLNFAKACNIGAKAARSDLLFFLNNDTILQERWLPPLLSALQTSPHPTAVAPMLLYPRFAGRLNRVQHLGLCFEPQFYPVHLYEGFPAGHPVCQKLRRFQALTGAAFMLPKNIFINAGLFDEGFVNGGEDVEIGLRLSAAGHILTCIPESTVYHLASQTPGIHTHAEFNARKLKEKAVALIAPDLHFFAEKDGYELALTPRLRPYLDLPERRKEVLSKRVSSVHTADELEDLIEREPICHAAYLPLAELYEKEEKFQMAADTVFLALKLRPHPELAEKLLSLAQVVSDEALMSYANNALAWYRDVGNFALAVQQATYMADFTQQVGMEKQSALYRQWLANKDTSASCFKNQTRKNDGTSRRIAAAKPLQILFPESQLFFNSDWYCKTYLAKKVGFFSAFKHFMTIGFCQGLNPHFLFSSQYYLAQLSPEERKYAEKINVIEHYLTKGAALHLNPTPLFDSKWYSDAYAVPKSGLTPFGHFLFHCKQGVMLDPNEFFDASWYMEHYSYDSAQYHHPLLHYLAHSGSMEIDPSPAFCTKTYLLHNPDVANTSINPLEHYLRFGRSEGRLMDRSNLYEKSEENYQVYLESSRKDSLVIYTAVTNGYSRLLPPAHLIPGARYICFSDTAHCDYGIWEVRPLPKTFSDPTRSSRYCKLHPHKLFPDAEFAVWVDGNIVIQEDIQPYIDAFARSGEPIGLIEHPLRNCLYEEGNICVEYGKDNAEIILQQLISYREAGIGEQAGLYETNVIINKLRHSQFSALYSLWWSELDKHSRRDQLSLPYALATLGITPYLILPRGTSARNSESFMYTTHEGTFAVNVPSWYSTQVSFPQAVQHFAQVRQERLEALPSIVADVIIPVHNAFEDTRDCINSVLPCLRSPGKLLIINDTSGAETTEWLRALSRESERIILLENERNLGYTLTANRGLRASQADFRILLNSDTVVSPDWQEKLILAAYYDDRTGGSSPLSNAASYQSIPDTTFTPGQTPINHMPPGATPYDLDQFCEQQALDGIYPAVPLLHGFCLGIRKELINAIGFFDEENFPRFYGEENDYCLRAGAAGFKLRIALHTYVFHKKSKSISDSIRIEGMRKAGERLRELHTPAKVMSAVKKLESNPYLIHMRNACTRFYAGSYVKR